MKKMHPWFCCPYVTPKNTAMSGLGAISLRDQYEAQKQAILATAQGRVTKAQGTPAYQAGRAAMMAKTGMTAAQYDAWAAQAAAKIRRDLEDESFLQKYKVPLLVGGAALVAFLFMSSTKSKPAVVGTGV